MKKKIILFLLIIQVTISLIFPSVKTIDLTETEIKNYNLCLRSVIYPGLGQYYMGDKNKGVIFSIITGLCIVGSVYSYYEANQIYADYTDMKYRDSNRYTDYSNKMDQMYGFMFLTAAIWIYNIFDAYKMNTKYFYEKKAKEGINVSLVDKNVSLLYSKTF